MSDVAVVFRLLVPVKLGVLYWFIRYQVPRINARLDRELAEYEEVQRLGYDPHMDERAAAYRKMHWGDD